MIDRRSSAIAHDGARSGRVNELDAHKPRAINQGGAAAQQGAHTPWHEARSSNDSLSHTHGCQQRHKRCHGRRDHHLRLAKILGAACSGQGARHGSAAPRGASEDDAASARGVHTQYAHPPRTHAIIPRAPAEGAHSRICRCTSSSRTPTARTSPCPCRLSSSCSSRSPPTAWCRRGGTPSRSRPCCRRPRPPACTVRAVAVAAAVFERARGMEEPRRSRAGAPWPAAAGRRRATAAGSPCGPGDGTHHPAWVVARAPKETEPRGGETTRTRRTRMPRVTASDGGDAHKYAPMATTVARLSLAGARAASLGASRAAVRGDRPRGALRVTVLIATRSSPPHGAPAAVPPPPPPIAGCRAGHRVPPRQVERPAVSGASPPPPVQLARGTRHTSPPSRVGARRRAPHRRPTPPAPPVAPLCSTAPMTCTTATTCRSTSPRRTTRSSRSSSASTPRTTSRAASSRCWTWRSGSAATSCRWQP